MDHTTITAYLAAHADPAYDAFHTRLVPTALPTFGVRTPDLRALAKEIEESDWVDEFLDTQDPKTYEELLLWGLVVAGRKVDFDTLRLRVDAFVPAIENWAACDSFCTSLKRVAKERDAWWAVIEHYAKSERAFEVRFAVVLSMTYFLTDEWIDSVLELWAQIDPSKGHSVEAALGWGLATGVAKQRKKTLKALATERYSPTVLHRAVRKSCESLRVSPEDKTYLKWLVR